MRILVVSDTHVPTIAQRLPQKILDEASVSDLIIHAGDLVSRNVLRQLSRVNRVEAVRGNMDFPEVASKLPVSRLLTLSRWRIGVAHGHEGMGRDTPERALTIFPRGAVDCVVYGHSHVAKSERREGVVLFNPGSPVAGRGGIGNSYGILELDDDIKPEIIPIRAPD